LCDIFFAVNGNVCEPRLIVLKSRLPLTPGMARALLGGKHFGGYARRIGLL
jgi:hypothetical protein